MGNSGSSKKVHPKEAFDAADTDNDGKLTPEEFGAMLKTAGFVLSSKRSAMLMGALDENGDLGYHVIIRQRREDPPPSRKALVSALTTASSGSG